MPEILLSASAYTNPESIDTRAHPALREDATVIDLERIYHADLPAMQPAKSNRNDRPSAHAATAILHYLDPLDRPCLYETTSLDRETREMIVRSLRDRAARPGTAILHATPSADDPKAAALLFWDLEHLKAFSKRPLFGRKDLSLVIADKEVEIRMPSEPALISRALKIIRTTLKSQMIEQDGVALHTSLVRSVTLPSTIHFNSIARFETPSTMTLRGAAGRDLVRELSRDMVELLPGRFVRQRDVTLAMLKEYDTNQFRLLACVAGGFDKSDIMPTAKAQLLFRSAVSKCRLSTVVQGRHPVAVSTHPEAKLATVARPTLKNNDRFPTWKFEFGYGHIRISDEEARQLPATLRRAGHFVLAQKHEIISLALGNFRNLHVGEDGEKSFSLNMRLRGSIQSSYREAVTPLLKKFITQAARSGRKDNAAAPQLESFGLYGQTYFFDPATIGAIRLHHENPDLYFYDRTNTPIGSLMLRKQDFPRAQRFIAELADRLGLYQIDETYAADPAFFGAINIETTDAGKTRRIRLVDTMVNSWSSTPPISAERVLDILSRRPGGMPLARGDILHPETQ